MKCINKRIGHHVKDEHDALCYDWLFLINRLGRGGDPCVPF